jgi:hypothetical protein
MHPRRGQDGHVYTAHPINSPEMNDEDENRRPRQPRLALLRDGLHHRGVHVRLTEEGPTLRSWPFICMREHQLQRIDKETLEPVGSRVSLCAL